VGEVCGFREADVRGIVREDQPDESWKTVADRGQEGGDIGGQAQVDGDGVVVLRFKQSDGA
jgi:hypothetical protein